MGNLEQKKQYLKFKNSINWLNNRLEKTKVSMNLNKDQQLSDQKKKQIGFFFFN